MRHPAGQGAAARHRRRAASSGGWRRGRRGRPWVGERSEEGRELARVLGDPGVVVAALPRIREPERDGEVRPDRFPDGGHDLVGEKRTRPLMSPPRRVGAPIGFRPEELIEQIAVRAVELHRIENRPRSPPRRRGRGRPRESSAGPMAASPSRARRVEAGRALVGRVGAIRSFRAALPADVPQLREDQTAGVVHRLGGLPRPAAASPKNAGTRLVPPADLATRCPR